MKPDLWQQRAIVALLWIVPSAYYIDLLTLGSFDLLRSVPPFGLVFNSMLAHMLHGRFDVDPQAIGVEAFVRNGRYLAYFGVFGAFLRSPLLLTGGLDRTDITLLSMAAAVCLNWLFRLAAVLTVARIAPSTPAGRSLLVLIIAAAALDGESIQFLRASIYQEVIEWSAALSSGFVLILLRMLLLPQVRQIGRFTALAVFAGLALLTRPSTGLGLYVSLVGVIGLTAVRAVRGRGWPALGRAARAPQFLVPIMILAACAGAAGLVNFSRWGNPFVFMDMRLYVKSQTVFLDRLPRLEQYGEFNLRRLLLGVQYYFFPIWTFRDAHGDFFFKQDMLQLVEAAELPPGSLMLSDPVAWLMAGLFATHALCRRMSLPFDRAFSLIALVGLAIPGILMLVFIYFAHRYRMEFYPFLEFASFLGLALLLRVRETVQRRWERPIVALGVVGAMTSHLTLAAYRMTPFAPAADLNLSQGVAHAYLDALRGHVIQFAPHAMP